MCLFSTVIQHLPGNVCVRGLHASEMSSLAKQRHEGLSATIQRQRNRDVPGRHSESLEKKLMVTADFRIRTSCVRTFQSNCP